MKIANKNASGYVANRQAFQGSNMFAEVSQYGYVVYSYGKHFPMYICLHPGGQDIWFANRDKRSRTTTRHQSQARPTWDGTKMHWLSTEWMRRIADGGYTAVVKYRIMTGAKP